MKNKYTKATSLLTLAILSGQSNAGTIIEKYLGPATVTVALTSKYAAPQLTAIDPETGKPNSKLPKVESISSTTEPNSKGEVTTTFAVGVKAATTKVDNAALIAAALELDPEMSAADKKKALTGWSLLAEISSGAAVEGEDGAEAAVGGLTYNVYAAKKDADNIPLFSVTLPPPLTESFSSSVTTKEDEDGNVIVSAAKAPTGSASYEGVASGALGESAGFSGVFTVSTKVTAYNPDKTIKNVWSSIDAPAAGKIASIVGEDASGATLTGTISFTAPKVLERTIADEAPVE